ncbi:MAG TPA: type II toxin-antitoxin system HicB family antitoxin [Candidatus Dormibacteraeota bacterium]|nr:type II toxin-antitoxin system HicB family antitoxin [Candidatus Dormibacteraeota bacterium]
MRTTPFLTHGGGREHEGLGPSRSLVGGISRYPESVAKVLVSIDDRLLERIDQVVRSRGQSRSGYLAELARRDLAVAAGPGRRAQVGRALRRLDTLFREHGVVGDATALVRAERDAR